METRWTRWNMDTDGLPVIFHGSNDGIDGNLMETGIEIDVE